MPRHAIVGIVALIATQNLAIMASRANAATLEGALGGRLSIARSTRPHQMSDGKFGRVEFGLSTSVSPARLNAVLSALVPDELASRSASEVRLYASVSPGVVLIATKDALGSGSVVSSEGLVLTNLHVVGNAKTVAVVFKPRVEGAEVTKTDIHVGTVVRRDQVSDLALVQVSDVPNNVRVIALASMTDIAIGSDVHAIGHPTGEAWTYTKGIVSQIRHNYEWIAEDGIKHDAVVIQTQTPINPGNSGGPLLTDSGTLVGVNSFKSEGEGLNFAVSVDDVRRLLSEKNDRLVKTVKSKTTSDACEPKSYGSSRLEDNSGTIESLDIDCSGKPDAQWILPDDPKEPARLEIDTQHNGIISGIMFSSRRDGKWDYSIWATTGSGKADLKCFHSNGNAEPTRCEKM